MAIGKLNPMRVAISGGLLWGLLCVLVAITAMYGWGDQMLNLFADFYIGYSASFTGAAIGFVWGFVDCFVLGFMFSYVFNWVGNLGFVKRWD